MKSLVWVVVEDFIVDIGQLEKLWYLKDMIKEKKTYDFPALKTDDLDVLQLKEDVVGTAISDIMTNKMDPSFSINSTAFGLPDKYANEDGDIHVLVKEPDPAVAKKKYHMKW
ncbi:Crinkler (CRN) [Phytophthora megakarya]|uniref:Crinkler (CRN) n=1 Tax=Phytophthora megakarya TaxID=4795 RepID=A0A225WIH2_9STRA|nr:Crinkler (CRN) [Phytophthora megakarya]